MNKYIQILCAGFVTAFFPLRDFLCKTLYPNMRTITGEWDGANNLTMDLFAAMFLCLSFIGWNNTKGCIRVVIAIALGLSAGDVADRMFGIREYTGFDLVSVPLAIIIPIYTYVQNRKCS